MCDTDTWEGEGGYVLTDEPSSGIIEDVPMSTFIRDAPSAVRPVGGGGSRGVLRTELRMQEVQTIK